MKALVLGLCILALTANVQANPITTDPDTCTTVTTTTPPSSTDPPYIGTGICENQEVDTLLPYPGRCELYIVCAEKAPIAYACPDGLEFNAELKTCQLPEKAGCSVIQVTTPATGVGICANYPIGELIPYPDDCSKYIRCDIPDFEVLECNDGFEFNEILQLCDYAEDAGCSSKATTLPDYSTTTLLTPPEMSGICRDQEEGDLLPYPHDCSKYIICENPIPIAWTCGADLHFNAYLGICDDMDSDGCFEGNLDVPTLPPDTDSPGLTGLCKNQQDGDFIAYPDNCSKYIRCENPVPIAEACKSGLYFNEALRICDSIESSNCQGQSTTEDPGEAGATTVPTTTTYKPPTLTGLCRDQEPSDLIPYPDDCSKYIACESPIPIAIACLDGLDFNAKLQICDDPEAAACATFPTTATPIPSPSSNVCCGLSIGALVPFPDDCSQYIRCEYPIPEALSCPDGEHFNADAEKCESAEDANCEWYSPTSTTTDGLQECANIANGVAFPYEGDCTKYNLCSNGVAVTLPCPVGSVFVQDAGGCIPGTTCLTPTTTSAPLTCATQPNGALLPYDGDCKKYNYCTMGTAITLPCPVGSVFSEDAAGCIPGTTCPIEVTTPGPVTCASQPNGALIPYDGDCKKYNYCTMGTAITLPCPVGSVFSEDAAGCIPGTTCPTSTPAQVTCATQPNGALLPYDGDCKKYNYCTMGTAIALPCPVGSVFSEDAGDCIRGYTCPI